MGITVLLTPIPFMENMAMPTVEIMVTPTVITVLPTVLTTPIMFMANMATPTVVIMVMHTETTVSTVVMVIPTVIMVMLTAIMVLPTAITATLMATMAFLMKLGTDTLPLNTLSLDVISPFMLSEESTLECTRQCPYTTRLLTIRSPIMTSTSTITTSLLSSTTILCTTKSHTSHTVMTTMNITRRSLTSSSSTNPMEVPCIMSPHSTCHATLIQIWTQSTTSRQLSITITTLSTELLTMLPVTVFLLPNTDSQLMILDTATSMQLPYTAI